MPDVSLNRTDLLRLCVQLRVLAETNQFRTELSRFFDGWLACVEAIESISAVMPDDCVLVKRSAFDRLNEESDHPLSRRTGESSR